MAASFDNALTAPAVARNRDPILAVLREVLAAPGTVLEIASGSGEHAVHFASALPHLVWQPTDPDDEARRSIAAHAARAQLPNLLPPLELDAAAAAWPVERDEFQRLHGPKLDVPVLIARASSRKVDTGFG